MIVVTAPTGNIGHHLVRDLLNRGEAVRVIVRDPAKLDDIVRDQVKVIKGSHGDADVIDRALEGADALFWLAPPVTIGTMEQAYSGFAHPAADAIRRHATGHVVAVTALGRGTQWQDRAGLVSASIRMVDTLNGTGAAVRGLAMPSFMENALMQLDAIRQGAMFGTLDQGRKVPHTATRDMAAAAARLLIDRSWTGQEDVAVLGPEDLSFDEVAWIVSDVTGREVRYQQVTMEDLKAQLLAGGMPEDFAQGYVDMFRAKDQGMDNAAVRTPANTGSTSFRRWAEEVLQPALNGKGA